mmetsp:Transcript_6223/g.7695  ORF Transcript_6223/g.7695 Transcript_6223/m.7695 type:complete len:342 (-) Transcript_6223:195-1220(-)
MSEVATATVPTAAIPVPDEPAIRKEMEALVKTVDLETITTKQFIRLLSAKMGGANLSSKKAYIKSTLTEVLDAMDEETDNEEETEDESDEEDQKKTANEKPKKRQRKETGLTVIKEISPEMASFLGKGTQMARTEVVKGLWNYIKANDLQNPDDRREILLDEKMKTLFKCDKFTMFTLNKYVGSHIHPFPAVNLNELSENSKKRKEEAARKRQAKIEAKRGNVKKVKRTHPPYRLSEQLKAVTGKDILPRPQVTQALWIYIKANNLQSDTDKRVIVCDEKLKPVMGGNDTVTIFTMNKHITPHMVEKLDRSAYVPEVKKEEQDGNDSEETEDEADSDDESS